MGSRSSNGGGASWWIARTLVTLRDSLAVAVGLDNHLKALDDHAYRRLVCWAILLQGAVLVAIGVHDILTFEPSPEPGMTGMLFRMTFGWRHYVGAWFGWAVVLYGVAYTIAMQIVLRYRPGARYPYEDHPQGSD